MQSNKRILELLEEIKDLKDIIQTNSKLLLKIDFENKEYSKIINNIKILINSAENNNFKSIYIHNLKKILE